MFRDLSPEARVEAGAAQRETCRKHRGGTRQSIRTDETVTEDYEVRNQAEAIAKTFQREENSTEKKISPATLFLATEKQPHESLVSARVNNAPPNTRGKEQRDIENPTCPNRMANAEE